MRQLEFRGWSLLQGELMVDNFAGGGGASVGQEAGAGRPPDIAINHSAKAIAMHKANHPDTKHFCQNILEIAPREATGGRPVGLAWFSPDCTHFSRAKGTAPRKKEIRDLAWVVIRWARDVRPRIIMLENVPEFETWGPIDEDGQPIKERSGETYSEWLAELRGLGYVVEVRHLVAADYGSPTIRKRLFLIARCDGAPIVWPTATHGEGKPIRWRSAAEIIDWSLPCPSIFDRKRPLAEATLARIAKGIQRYVVEADDPFIVPLTHAGDSRVHGINEPVRTITGAHRGELALVDPFLVKYHGGARARLHSPGEPLRTIDASNRFAIVEPFIARTAHGEVDRRGKRRGRGQHSAREPLPTVTASNDFAVVEPFIVRHGHYSTISGAGLREGCGAGTFRGQPLDSPLATVCATNDKHLVCPIVTKHNGGPHGGAIGQDARRALGTVTARDQHALTAAFLSKFYGTSTGAPMAAPAPTVTAGGRRGGGHIAEVRAFMTKFYSAGGNGAKQTARVTDPMHTVTAKARFGLVMVHGEPYRIVDIGMRMLQPHELFAAQGFPDDYEIAPWFNGKPLTKTDQTELAGNSVCPQVAEALVAANCRATPAMRAA